MTFGVVIRQRLDSLEPLAELCRQIGVAVDCQMTGGHGISGCHSSVHQQSKYVGVATECDVRSALRRLFVPELVPFTGVFTSNR